MKKLLCAVLTLCIVINTIAEEESKKDFDERMQWFDEAKFGLFIHWGAYSTLGGVYKGKNIDGYAEWIQAGADIPKKDYVEVTKKFNPEKFDADQWIKTAKKAGMKYMVITTKHHDGFCLWDSKHTTYDIKDMAGVEKDLLKELSKACKKHDMVFGTYYSIIDWHHPTQKPNPRGKNSWKKLSNCLMNGPDAKPEYMKYMKNQCKELADRYDTQVYWFDGDWNDFWTMEDGMDLYNYLRELQPTAIINNRVAKRETFKKDFGTPEQFTPGKKLDYYWEACWTINHSWGFKSHDTKWKSTETLIKELVDIVSKGGNYLLNVGPKPDGTWPEACTERLLEMGEWLAGNGDAIYGTSFSELPLQSWGRITKKDNTQYLHVFDWPKDRKLVLEGVTGKVKKAILWGEKKTDVKLTSSSRSIEMTLPSSAPQKHVNVVELVFKKNSVKVHDTIRGAKLQNDDIVLGAASAKIGGEGKLRFETNTKNLGWWTSDKNTATWKTTVPVGTYDVIVVAAKPHDGGIYEISCGDQLVSGTTEKTGSWQNYKPQTDGTMKFDFDGEQEFVIKGKDIQNKALFNLSGIILRKK